ncbi:MAG: glycosyltransferase family 9 protein [Pirellula sp.]|jgi:heptosyltransferase-2|nr:glycosyltransferase family 9 protein [Pirellula sp.]
MKIAAILPTWLGDTCMATPTLRAIFEHSEVEELLLIGRSAPIELLRGAPFAKNLLKFKPQSRTPGTLGRRQLVRALKSSGMDAIVLFPNSFSSAVIAFLSGIPRRIGYIRDGRGFFLTEGLSLNHTEIDSCTGESKVVSWRDRALVEYYAQLAVPLGCSPQDMRMEIGRSDEDGFLAKECYRQLGLDPTKPTVVLNNGSATAASRLWSTQYCAILAHELASQKIQVIVHSGPTERLGANEIASAADHPLVQSMGHIDPLPISLSRGVIGSADLVITTDSGVRHMATALGRKTIVLYGPTSQSNTKTYHNREMAISAQLPCQPCVKNVCPLKHNRCMSDIKPERVLQAALTQLQVKSPKDSHTLAA